MEVGGGRGVGSKGRLASLGFPFHLSLDVLGKLLESVRVIA